MTQAVLAYLEQNQARFVQELCEYVRFPSISTLPERRGDLQACAEWLLQHCQHIGLEARLCPTRGNPILVAKTPRTRRSPKPRFVVYGHYDVQPPDPLDLWNSPPFEPRIKGRLLFARGASDNKGQHLAHLKAVEAYLKTGSELPCDLTFVIEGEEEVGSRSLAEFLAANRTELRCQAVVVSDTGMPAPGQAALTYALRGIVALEVKLVGPNRDLHSGIFGGCVDNPAMVLCQLLAKLRDARGRIAIPGFYQDVAPLSAYERKQLARLPYKERDFVKFLGVPSLFGEKGYTPWEQRTARPTLEINGLTSGYQGEGSKTIIPAWASAKLTLRLVPRQNPRRVAVTLVRRLCALCPPTVRLEASVSHSGQPYCISPTSPNAQAALRALRTAFGREPILHREGGSIAIVTDFRGILGADTLLLGLALPDDNPHSPNENFSLDNFAAGMRLGAVLWPELANATR
jgi:acetylornithine deacetylase/succinyl-diaminopimelate desuccinylase-like protein